MSLDRWQIDCQGYCRTSMAMPRDAGSSRRAMQPNGLAMLSYDSPMPSAPLKSAPFSALL